MFRSAFKLLLLCLIASGFMAARAEPQKFQNPDGEWIDPFRDETMKATILIFVRTDCPISNRYAAELQRIYKEFARQTRWWLVYPDDDLTGKAIREHQKEYKLDIPVLRDPNHDLVRLAGVQVTPEAAVFLPGKKLGYRGRIDDRFAAFGNYRSEATRHDLEEALTDVVNGKPVRVAETKAIGCTIGSAP